MSGEQRAVVEEQKSDFLPVTFFKNESLLLWIFGK